MFNDDFKLKPTTAEEINECADPRGMRKRLHQYSYRGGRMPLVRAVYRMAEAHGLSGEDLMTWLAFEALKALEDHYDARIEAAMLNVQPLLVGTATRKSQ